MGYEISKNMSVVTTHKLRVEIDQNDISVVWSKEIWGSEYVQAKNGRYQYRGSS